MKKKCQNFSCLFLCFLFIFFFYEMKHRFPYRRSKKNSEFSVFQTKGKSQESVNMENDSIINRHHYDDDYDHSADEEEQYSYSYRSVESRQRSSPSTVGNSKKFVSENNIQYESLSQRMVKDTEQQVLNKRRPNSSGNEIFSEYDSYTVSSTATSHNKSTSIKEYKRFYGTSNEDTCDDELKKSSDESSSSPNSKSILNSPDTVIPLLQSSPPLPPSITSIPTVSSPITKNSRPSRIPISRGSLKKNKSLNLLFSLAQAQYRC